MHTLVESNLYELILLENIYRNKRKNYKKKKKGAKKRVSSRKPCSMANIQAAPRRRRKRRSNHLKNGPHFVTGAGIFRLQPPHSPWSHHHPPATTILLIYRRRSKTFIRLPQPNLRSPETWILTWLDRKYSATRTPTPTADLAGEIHWNRAVAIAAWRRFGRRWDRVQDRWQEREEGCRMELRRRITIFGRCCPRWMGVDGRDSFWRRWGARDGWWSRWRGTNEVVGWCVLGALTTVRWRRGWWWSLTIDKLLAKWETENDMHYSSYANWFVVVVSFVKPVSSNVGRTGLHCRPLWSKLNCLAILAHFFFFLEKNYLNNIVFHLLSNKT